MKAIKHPFSLDTFGRINSTTDSNKIYLDRLLSLLSTDVYQKPMSPNYGTDIIRALYETGQNYTQAIQEAIERAVSTYLPNLKIVSIRFLETTPEGVSNVEVSVSFPDNTVNSISVSTASMLSNGAILGELI